MSTSQGKEIVVTTTKKRNVVQAALTLFLNGTSPATHHTTEKESPINQIFRDIEQILLRKGALSHFLLFIHPGTPNIAKAEKPHAGKMVDESGRKM